MVNKITKVPNEKCVLALRKLFLIVTWRINENLHVSPCLPTEMAKP